MNLLCGAIVNEVEKLFRKRRLMIVIVILTVLQLIVGALLYLNKEEFQADPNWKQNLQQEVIAMESQISQMPPGIVEKEQMEQEVAKRKFQLEHDINPNPPGAAGDLVNSVTAPFITTILPLLMIVVGADLVSGETSDRTMKSMLIRPVGRTAILWAKWITFILVSVAIMMYSFLINYLITAFVMGFGDFSDQIVITTNVFTAVSIWQYLLISFGLNLGTVVVLASVILLISVLVRSSSVSVSLSMVLIVVGALLVNMGTKMSGMKYFFLPNLDLVSHLAGTFRIPDVSLAFSLLVMLGTTVISLVIAFVVFRKRDMSL